MIDSLRFAHVTDIHISERDTSGKPSDSLAACLMRECVAHLNDLSDLDFVLITGDVLDVASIAELDTFLEILEDLHKPWHFVPGNHDGFIDPRHPGALKPHEAVMRVDPRMTKPVPVVQQAFWSRQLSPGVQLIALDTRIADDWAGEIGQAQIDWLRGQSEAHQEDMVIVATHHPLHPLGPHNTRGILHKFICANGCEVEAVLDCHPNVKMVISGHHHTNHLSLVDNDGWQRLRVVTAALGAYPCSYRTIRLERQVSGWRVDIQTHCAADEAMLQMAHERAKASGIAREFDPDSPAAWAAFCEGRPEDLVFHGCLR
ncbi:MAG: metallophosphoesterase [Anaerolineae bacterium]|nr:metallophosphoesterase [Anaerolineae bacterium]